MARKNRKDKYVVLKESVETREEVQGIANVLTTRGSIHVLANSEMIGSGKKKERKRKTKKGR